MSKKFFSKKRLKKINKTLSSPAVRYVGGGIISLAAVGALKVLSEKYPFVGDILRGEGIEEEKNHVSESVNPETEVQI